MFYALNSVSGNYRANLIVLLIKIMHFLDNEMIHTLSNPDVGQNEGIYQLNSF